MKSYCGNHRLDIIYCICRGNNVDADMISCDCCMEWYH
jgi:hypothetical protein